jgi:hypothetical protein
MLDKFMLGMFYVVGSGLIALIIAAVITITLINAPQYRVNFTQSGITLNK